MADAVIISTAWRGGNSNEKNNPGNNNNNNKLNETEQQIPTTVCTFRSDLYVYIIFSNVLTRIYWPTHVGRVFVLLSRDNLVSFFFFNFQNFKRFGNSDKTVFLHAINTSSVFLIVAKQRDAIRSRSFFGGFHILKTIACY